MDSNRDAIKFFTEELFMKNDRKIVTIWGAGTSIKAGVPSGYYLMQRMKKDLLIYIDTLYCKEKLRKELKKISYKLKNSNDISFEYVMWVYGKIYGRERLHLWLKEYIKPMTSNPNPPYFPSFGHEYCSHLAKSGLLEYFVVANFDEILETTFEDELGFENFKIIASKSEFESLRNVRIDEWKRIHSLYKTNCFIFKPHGTISRMLTLRETPASVSHFEEEKRDVLIEILKDSIIVFLGFGNYNENFWLLFGETYSMGLTKDIIVVDTNPKQVREKLPDERLNSRIYEFDGEVDDFFLELYNFQKTIPGKQLPTRHIIRSKFFDLFSRELRTVEGEKEFKTRIESLKKIPYRWWYDLRIYELELLIYLFKSRGLFIQLSAANCPRIKKAYLKCLAWQEEWKLLFPNLDEEHKKIAGEIVNIKLEPTEILNSILNIVGEEDKDLFGKGEVLDRFNIKSIKTFWCFLKISKSFHDDFMNQIENKTKVIKALDSVFDEYCACVSERYGDYLNLKIEEICNNNANDIFSRKKHNQFVCDFKEEIKELFYDFDIDIMDSDISTSMRFSAPTQILRKKMLYDETNKILLSKGNTLRIASVSAEWLSKRIDPRANRKSMEVVSYMSKIEKIKIISNIAMFQILQSNKDKILPMNLFHYKQMMVSIVQLIKHIKRNATITNINIEWFGIRNLHHHMTIVSNEKNGKVVNLENESRAIYFRRPGKEAEISPVLLTKSEDIDPLIEYFDERIKCLETNANQGGLLFTIRKNSENVSIELNNYKDNTILRGKEWNNLEQIMRLLTRNKNIEIYDKWKNPISLTNKTDVNLSSN